MVSERFPELLELSEDEKRELISDLCSDVADKQADGPDARIVEILEQRWKEYRSDPSSAISLEEFRKKIGWPK